MLTVVRPSAVKLLEPPQRLAFMAEALRRFFPWVWSAVILLPLTGYALLFWVYGGMAAAPVYLHLMQLVGWVMITVFGWISLVAYRRLIRARAQQQTTAAAAALEQIRRLVQLNTLLGVLVLVVAGAGRYWS
ncbi:CopD family protein [Motiliproteus sediminis]|uniref:CopD family protein n=1 Tax=Motiliproteus sediminis TaxID=1468178 RepID=UPI001AF009AD|nr:CopD family protein [Motiliproteus sediminis]